LDVGHWTLDVGPFSPVELKLPCFFPYGKAAEKSAKNNALVAGRGDRDVSGMQSGVRISHGNPLLRLRRTPVSNLCAGHNKVGIFVSRLR
jgi:hypothetical protein